MSQMSGVMGDGDGIACLGWHFGIFAVLNGLAMAMMVVRAKRRG